MLSLLMVVVLLGPIGCQESPADETAASRQQSLKAGVTLASSHWQAPLLGGETTVELVASREDAPWQVRSTADWLSVTPASGQGSATLRLVALANNHSLEGRTASVAVGGATLTVYQPGDAPYGVSSVSSVSLNFTAAAGTSTLIVTVTNTTKLTATSNSSWLSVTQVSPCSLHTASQTYRCTVALSAQAHTASVNARTANLTLTHEGSTTIYPVTQNGATPVYTLSPASWAAPVGGGAVNATLGATPTNAPWTATTNAGGWLSLSPTSGTGSRTVSITATSNAGTIVARSGTVTIGGKTINVTQPGATATYAISSTQWQAPVSGGSNVVGVTVSPADAPAWTTSNGGATWISFSPASGTGTRDVTVTAQAHTTSINARTATVTIAGKSFRVDQAGATPSYSVNLTSWNFAAGSGTKTFTLTATPSNAPWTASSNQSWLTVSPTSSTGTKTVTLTAASNANTIQGRSATVTIAGYTVSVTQSGATPNYTIAPTTWAAPVAGGTRNVTLTVTPGDAPGWTASSPEDWITVSPTSGTGTQTLTLTAASNAATIVGRSATLTIAGKSLTVTQPGATPILNPAGTWNAPVNGGTRNVTVTMTALDQPDWTATTNCTWVSVAPDTGTGGAGTHTVVVTAQANRTTDARSPNCTVNIGGTSFAVTQAGVAPTSLTPSTWTLPNQGGSQEFSLAVPADVAWTVARLPAGVTASPSSGTGPGTFTLTAPVRNSICALTGTPGVGTRNITFSQVGRVGVLTLTPEDWTAPNTLSTRTYTVTADPNDTAWTMTSDQAWFTINSGVTSFTGSGTLAGTSVTLRTAAHAAAGAGSSIFPRQATATLATRNPGGSCVFVGHGTSVTTSVTQDGATPTYSISPTSWTAPVAGGDGVLNLVALPMDTPWTATTPTAWLSLSDSAGLGSQAITVTAQSNATSIHTRSGSVTAGGQTVTVTQPGATPIWNVSPETWDAPVAGGTQIVVLTSNVVDGTWTAQSNAPWLSVSPTSGMGGADVTVAALSNASSARSRQGTVTIAGKTVTVSQAGTPPVFTLTPNTWSVSDEGGTTNVALAVTPEDAEWTAVAPGSWLSISPASGEGPRQLTFTAPIHTTSAWPRQTTVTIGDATITVTQAATPTVYEIDVTEWNVGDEGGQQTVDLTAFPDDAPWTVDFEVDWLSASPASGAGSAAIALVAAPHTASITPRSARVTIGGRELTVIQEGAPGDFTITPTQWQAPGEGGSTTVSVVGAASDFPWQASGGATWLTLSRTQGTGPADITITAAPNPSYLSAREVTIAFGPHQLRITQPPLSGEAVLTPAGLHYTRTGGMRTMALSVDPPEMTWTVGVGGANWLEVTPASGTGPATLLVRVQPNLASVQPRATQLEVGGTTVTISQDGGVPTYTVLPASWQAPPQGGTLDLQIGMNIPDAFWEVISRAHWLTPSAVAGAGEAVVRLVALPNPSARTARTTTLTVAGKAVRVTQAPVPMTFDLSPAVLTAEPFGSTHTVEVIPSHPDGTWKAIASDSWMSVNPRQGTGRRTLVVTVAPIPHTAEPRVGMVTLGDDAISVEQDAAPASRAISPTRLHSAPGGGVHRIRVATSHADVDWTATSAVGWIALSPGAGTGPGVVELTTTAHGAGSTRTAQVTIAGQTVEVTQGPDPDDAILVAAGSYPQGSPSSEVGRTTLETPRTVRLTRDFYLERTPVTQGHYATRTGQHPSEWPSCPNCPVERVNWFEAVTFANQRSQSQGLNACYVLSGCTGSAQGTTPLSCRTVKFEGVRCSGWRLPTEAEWEVAARAGTTSPRYHYDLGAMAWWAGNSNGHPQPVGARAANAWGLADMIGNVAQWTHDGRATYGGATVPDPTGALTGTLRALRGCSHADAEPLCRAASRQFLAPAQRLGTVGFRLARSRTSDDFHPTLTNIRATSLAFADGQDSVTVIIRVMSRDSQPMPGITPSFGASGLGNTYETCAPSDAQGYAVCRMRSTVAEAKRLFLLTPVAIAGPTISFRTPPSTTRSTIRAQNNVLADGVAQAFVAIELREPSGAAIAGVTPTFEASGSGHTLLPCAPTNAQGLSLCAMTSTLALPTTLRVTAPVTIDGPTITFRTPVQGEPAQWVLVSADTYRQGSPRGEAGRRTNEVPRDVTLTRDFLIQTTPVTQKQWTDQMGNNPAAHKTCGPDCPVEQVNWFEALAFANARSLAQGLTACYNLVGCSGSAGGIMPLSCTHAAWQDPDCPGYRLPTEAEWELAARAGVKAAHYDHIAIASWYSANSQARTWRTGLKLENPAGLFDVLGNTRQWTFDGYQATWSATPTVDPQGIETLQNRSVRGCFYGSPATDCRFAARLGIRPQMRSREIGLRLVRTQPAAAGMQAVHAMAPLAQDDTLRLDPSAFQGQTPLVVLEPLANDLDPLGATLHLGDIVRRPALGELTEQGDTLVYHSRPGATGVDQLVYEVCNTQGHCAQATMTIALEGLPIRHDSPASGESSTTCSARPVGGPAPLGIARVVSAGLLALAALRVLGAGRIGRRRGQA